MLRHTPPPPPPLQHYALNFFVFYCPSLSIVFSFCSFVPKFSLSLCLSRSVSLCLSLSHNLLGRCKQDREFAALFQILDRRFQRDIFRRSFSPLWVPHLPPDKPPLFYVKLNNVHVFLPIPALLPFLTHINSLNEMNLVLYKLY